MSWDSQTIGRRRQNSNAATTGRTRGLSIRQAAKAQAALTTPVKIDPKSAHTSDPFLQGFLNPAFDPAEYLNATLPPLQGSSSSQSLPLSSSASSSSSSSAPAKATPVPLAQLSSGAQDLLTQLSAHTTRLANTLTQLTDDILRGGSRLAYEVELLRGETLGLAETLQAEGPLRGDLERLAGPAGEQQQQATSASGRPRSSSSAVASSVPATPATDGTRARDGSGTPGAGMEANGEEEEEEKKKKPTGDEQDPNEPKHISQLRTLTLVRSRLDSVIRTFGDAMEFTFPPSEFSVSSGFLSVSAPEFPDMIEQRSSPSSDGQVSTEERGQQVLRRVRGEVSALLARGRPEPVRGVEEATRRVEELKELSAVWRGTAEERARQRFVESLARMVEDRHRELLREAEAAREQASREGRGRQDDAGAPRRATGGGSSETTATESRGLGGYGFMKKWQDLRGGL
ncbi:hypothetical protein VPNG_01056 [Cytospora leucostoma]|uniref:Uncharacterized protein n=1 Tax=Cytospora leucostoma TaxID=1230097 RepID=A0A423XLI7_9PEZI|nr:hypothetical protein VPNG_01056 [Cytospora leucostoma]